MSVQQHPSLDHRQVELYRYATLAGGLFYLAWWGAVELLLPGSFNPLASRLVVVLFCLGVFGASFRARAVAAHMSGWFLASTCAVTLHYFYLFGRNASDINWVVGTYILIIAVSASTSTLGELLAYAAFVLVLSGVLVVVSPALLHTIFLSGVVTIFVFAYVGLRARLRLVTRSRETAERVQSLFDAVFEGIVVHDHGRIIDTNESFATLFGYLREELPGMEVASLTASESRPLVAAQLSSNSTATYEITGLRKDGSTIPLELSAKTHLLDGRPVRLTAVRDLTDQRRAERTRILYEAAQQSLAIRDEFMLIVSHELKTPITNLKLQTQLARRDFTRSGLPDPSAERMMRYLDHADRQITRLSALIEDVVDIARIESGALKIAREPVDLAQLARGVVASLSASLQQAGCAVSVDAEHPVFALADPLRVEQVLVNLLTNAQKYAAGSPIAVSVALKGADAVLIVADQGPGIAKADANRIFERFERAVSARHISGLGLGLFICKYIAELHGGRIELESEPDQGARFSVFLLAGDAPSLPTTNA